MLKGTQSHHDERREATSTVSSLKESRHGKPKSVTLDGLEDNNEFWSLLGGKPSSEPAAVPDEAKAVEKQSKLLRLSNHNLKGELKLEKVAEGNNVKKSL